MSQDLPAEGHPIQEHPDDGGAPAPSPRQVPAQDRHHRHHRHQLTRRTRHAAWIGPLVTAVVIGLAFVAVYVGLQRDPEPERLPLAVTGGQLATGVRDALGDKVAVVEVASADQGRRLVEDGRVIGVLTMKAPTGLEFDYAGAQGLSETGAAQRMVGAVAQAMKVDLVQRDIVPLVRYDSRGLVTFYVVFGVTLSSFILAQALSGNAAHVRLRHRLLVLAGFATLIGLAAAVLAGPVYSSVQVPFVELAAVLVLLSAASAFGTKALTTWLGPVGIGLAVLTLTVAGNATSGASIGVYLMPGWARTLSDVLPQGAAVRALDSAGYFDGSATWSAVLVLLLWAGIGLALVLLHHVRAATPQISERQVPAGLHVAGRPALHRDAE